MHLLWDAHVIGSLVYSFIFPPALSQRIDLGDVVTISKMLKIKLLIYILITDIYIGLQMLEIVPFLDTANS